MASLGVSIGSEVLVRQNYGYGPLIVVVHDTRIALGRGEAAKVLAEETAYEPEPADKG
jgi:ferrous iron transport protein A